MSKITAIPELKPLSIAETLRVMDVATEIRRQQELVESQFHTDELKSKLRKSLQAASVATGEAVNEAQIEQAISWYYDHLHKYTLPKPGLRVFAAHLYIRRGWVFALLILMLFFAGGAWLVYWLISWLVS